MPDVLGSLKSSGFERTHFAEDAISKTPTLVADRPFISKFLLFFAEFSHWDASWKCIISSWGNILLIKKSKHYRDFLYGNKQPNQRIIYLRKLIIIFAIMLRPSGRNHVACAVATSNTKLSAAQSRSKRNLFAT